MSSNASVAASLSPDTRQKIVIEALAQSKRIGYLAAEHQISRKFVYQQGHKAKSGFSEAFELKQTDHKVFSCPLQKNGCSNPLWLWS